MAKIKLNLEQLEVESFGTASAESTRGTVNAHDFTEVSSFCQGCTRNPTCDVACSTDQYEVCYEPWTRQSGCTDGLDCTA
jgi:hypothetical protein